MVQIAIKPSVFYPRAEGAVITAPDSVGAVVTDTNLEKEVPGAAKHTPVHQMFHLVSRW
jgi:hypothetical protein